MSEEKLTAAQQAVIDNSGGALLVSAAAGSGKTMVLVRRLLKALADETDPKNIDDFLIITYTKAAASELKSKIARAISKRLSKEPSNRHLARQLNRLCLAQISTVHSFCASLLRDYAHEMELPADFKVAEERESLALQQKALRQTLDEVYETIEQDAAVQCFIETLGFGRDDRKAGKIVLRLYDTMLTHADPEKWMKEAVAAAAPEAGATPAWETYLIDSTKQSFARLTAQAEGLARLCQETPPFDTLYAPLLLSDAEVFRRYSELSSWEEFRAAGRPAFARASRVPADADQDFKQLISERRSKLKDKAKDLVALFSMERTAALEESKDSALAITGAFTVVERFREAYKAEKRRRHLLDYSDLEHEALRLLIQRGTRNPTRIAREVSNRYAEIMVDEYQDTNEIQDMIFSAVSKDERNLFMVGDVKQSIYRFRMADPTIFLRKYHTYTDYTQAASEEPRKILLSANFRSKPEILDAANSVFFATMSEEVGDLDYGPDEALYDERHQPLSETPLVELHCIDATQDNSSTDDDEEDFDKPEIEAEWIAGRIAELLESGEAEPGDITILLRAANSDARYYLAALERRGIPTQSMGGGSILNTVEIEGLHNLLRIIDNPHQDIPLIGAMTSPIFGFTYDTMSAIRTAGTKLDFYDALCRKAEQEEDLRRFLETLTHLQTEQRLLRLSELLELLERELSLRNIFAAMENGALRVRNLNLFYQLCSEFETEEPKTLHELLDYLEELDEQELGPAAEQSNAVQICSIHKSKGLEYPIVFLAGLSKKYNLKDTTESVLSHPQLGAACDVVVPKKHIRYATCAKKAIGRKLASESISEEMRVLYVAMTRPKNRLIMTYCADKLQKQLQRLCLLAAGLPLEQAAAEAAAIGDWVILTAIGRMEGACLSSYAGVEVEKTLSEIPWRIEVHEPQTRSKSKATSQKAQVNAVELPPLEELKKTLSFDYPFDAATRIPKKVTATQLKGRAIDQESAEAAEQSLPVRHFRFPQPQFAAQKKALTGAERGTATHLAMQYIRYEHCDSLEGVRDELARLKRERFLTEQQLDAVAPETLWAFFSSELGEGVRTAENIVREFKFSVFMDAGVLDPEAKGEQVMLQGVTDCCILEPDGFTVIDYKTDRVAQGAEARLADYYRGQLEAYGTALSRVFGLPVKQRLLYFFATGTFREV